MSTEARNTRSEDLDLRSTREILEIINDEDQGVAAAVRAAIPRIERTVSVVVETIRAGGRVFYVGAGTSGRLGVLDSSECPPTFGTPAGWFQGVIAGGPEALTTAVEGAEDDSEQAVVDLKQLGFSGRDALIAIAASGRTPYTLEAIRCAKSLGASSVALVCSLESPMATLADVAIEVAVGPEVLSGSTRMKAGTAQKMVLNMISTAAMVRLGLTYGNWMINVAMTNQKLRRRGVAIVRDILATTDENAERLVEVSGNQLKVAVVMGRTGCNRADAEQKLAAANGSLRAVFHEA